MRHHPVLIGTGPFRVHSDDPPFVMNAETYARFTSPNTTESRQAQADLEIERKGQGKTPPDPAAFRRFDGPGTPHPTSAGPMVDEAHAMVRFVPDVGPGSTDASYHLPAFYELFARWGPADDREFWRRAAAVSRDLFSRVTGPATGLSPDRSNLDLSPIPGRDGQPLPFGYDSWRTVSNWSVDYSWWRKDPRETALSDRLQTFLVGQGLSTFPDRYTLEGRPLSSRHSTGMVATATVGGLAAPPGPHERAFVEELWRTPVPVGEQRYFDGMLYLMSLLHCSGRFQIWQGKCPPGSRGAGDL